jgi:hypothetical protein
MLLSVEVTLKAVSVRLRAWKAKASTDVCGKPAGLTDRTCDKEDQVKFFFRYFEGFGLKLVLLGKLARYTLMLRYNPPLSPKIS